MLFKTLLFCGLVCLATCDQQAGDDGDDGSYIAEKYENPYAQQQGGNSIYQPQAYQQQPAGQQQGGYYAQPQQRAYRPAVAQQYNGDARNAAILSEQRYLNGDGKFGAAYTQEDGVEFKEESDPDGTRRGTYSYVDPSGQRKTVSYTAGKHGFIASGDHLPVGPASLPQVAPQPEPQYQPQARYQPQAQYQAEPQYQPQAQYQPQPQYSQPQPRYQPQPQYQPQVREPIGHNGVTTNEGGYTFSGNF